MSMTPRRSGRQSVGKPTTIRLPPDLQDMLEEIGRLRPDQPSVSHLIREFVANGAQREIRRVRQLVAE